MLPATAVRGRRLRHRAPVSAVVVVLPLLPVMAITRACGARRGVEAQANSSISDTTGTPALPPRLNQRFLRWGRREKWRSVRRRQKSLGAERAGKQRSPRALRARSASTLWRRSAAIGDAHARALPRQPPGHRQPAFAEAEDECPLSLKVHVSAASGSTGRPAPA
jgi:hypothetical protein